MEIDKAALSPMMRQYVEVKDENKGAIVFFRLGDFYEMFFDDAKLVSNELDLTLTGRDCGIGERAPMCGVPYHSAESYIARLIAKGYKVAICDQTESAVTAKGLVTREVTRVITPGTVLEESMLDESKNNYICSIYIEKNAAGICFCDISTAQIKVTEFSDTTLEVLNEIKNELGKFLPKEVLISGEIEFLSPLKNFLKEKLACNIEYIENKGKINEFSNFFEKINDKILCKKALEILFIYLKNTQKKGLERFNKIDFYSGAEFMSLDLNTIRNLEILETERRKTKKGSLLWVLDNTKTAMGKRMLRNWCERPLINKNAVENRQNAVLELFKNVILRDEIGQALMGVHDIERLITRIVYKSANARDLRSLAAAISKLPEIKNLLKNVKNTTLQTVFSKLDTLEDVFKIIDDAIVDEPPFLIREGGLIKAGFDKNLDEFRQDMNGGKDILARIEAEERAKTGISKLKVGFNKVFGYFIEITNSQKDMVPENYIRKQTLSNCERFITPELKVLENRILGAKDKSIELEYEIFDEIRQKTAEHISRITKSAELIAFLDVLRSFAEAAVNNNYTMPEIAENGEIIIKDGRHPVVEKLLNDAPFVPNDINLNENVRSIIITGPNMAGKSTYMRQVALIVLMAQMGSFVPANYAKISVVDAIFTRIGASDDLSAGQSTFMVEMSEVAEILKNATSKSLIILDEIGRGTSTFDGMSIAKATLEYVNNPEKIGSKTLFATHYHELTSMVNENEGIENFNIAVKKIDDDITFLRRIVPGAADDSYGIEVAKLAGLPKEVLKRAKEVLKKTEEQNSAPCFQTEIVSFKPTQICENSAANDILEKLKNLDANILTPIEAMNKLFKLIKIANKRG